MEVLNQFGVNPILLLAQVVNFLVLLFILQKFLYKPILKVLTERRQKIEYSLKKAEEIETRLSQTNEEVDKMLAQALEESQRIIAESKEMGIQITGEAKETATEIVQKAYEQALEVSKSERIKLQQEIRANLGDIVALALEKVTGKAISEKQRQDIIEKEVRNLS